jgi:hypothetical protein
MSNAREQLLRSGMDVVHINGGKGGPNISVQVASLLGSEIKPGALIFFGFGSGGDESDSHFYNGSHFKEALKSWCAGGGRFIVQGEGTRRTGNWPSWFDKNWKDCDYFRTDHKCFAVGPNATNWCEWYKNSMGAVLSTYNVKACMLENVDAEEILFGTMEDSQSYSLVPGFGGQNIGGGKTAVAFGKFGSGTVSFFGDVNHETDTLKIMAVIARGN